MQENKNNIPAKPEDEIDLIPLIKILWEGRKKVVKTTIIFMLIGVLVAIFSKSEYTAYTTMVPQSMEGGSKLGGSLGGLAAMAGFNLGSMGGGSDIPPTLYPKIVSSIPFQKELMETPLSIDGQSEQVTFAYFYEEVFNPGLFGYIKKYSIGLPAVIFKNIRKNDQHNKNEQGGLLTVSREEKELIEILQKQVTIDFNDKDGYISLSARMPEAKAAAQMVQKAQILLQDAITDFKIQKAKDQLSFVEERYAEKEKEAIAAQKKLAKFRDHNKNVSTATAQSEQERLVAEYNLIYGVYSELAKQLEKQKIQVKENTPIFTIIEPVVVPFEKSKPKRVMILIIYTFLGAIIGVIMVFGREFFETSRDRWMNQ